MNKKISEALVRLFQEGTSSAANDVIRVCHQEGQPDFDDGATMKRVFASPEFKEIVEREVIKQIELDNARNQP